MRKSSSELDPTEWIEETREVYPRDERNEYDTELLLLRRRS